MVSLNKSKYKYVLIHPRWTPTRSQVVPFYDRVYNSEPIEYRGKTYNGLFLLEDHHFHRLRKLGKGWEDITDDFNKYTEELKEEKDTEELEEPVPVKRKRGRPRKKRN
jgi:hypothetical protein